VQGPFVFRGPEPSKFAVLFYYVSVVCCMIGIIAMIKCIYLPVTLITGIIVVIK
jgi:hypothetical protein